MVSCGVAALVCVATVAAAVAVVVTATTPAATSTPAVNVTAAPSIAGEVDRKTREMPSRRREGLRGAAGSSWRRQPEWRLGRQTTPGRQTTLDPRMTWESFLRHSERTQTARPKKKVDRSFLRMEGPQGPPGPRGPRGPAGANITREEMFREFKGLLREAAERRAQVMVEMQCKNSTNCSMPLSGGANATDSLLPWLPPLVEIDRASMLPRSQSGFFWELSQEIRARKGKELRLQPFHRPFAEGSFERGSGLNATRGMFRAPMSGLYLFFATAFTSRPVSARALRKQLETSANDASLIVCVNARCQKNLSLRTTSEFGDGEYTMSLSTSGPLMLRAGQVVSLWFHNRTPYQITIHEGSQFSGLLVGL
nr:adipolin-like [Dermacentor andersoni]